MTLAEKAIEDRLEEAVTDKAAENRVENGTKVSKMITWNFTYPGNKFWLDSS